MNPLLCFTYLLMALSLTFTIGCTEQTPSSGQDLGGKSDSKSIKNADNSSKNTSKDGAYAVIDWTDLLPDEDLEALENPPAYLAEIEDGSERDRLTSQLKAESTENNPSLTNNTDSAEDRYQQALTSTKVRAEFHGRQVRVPGFIVPLTFDDHQTITTFFLVPFFGACLHMPPPPPNQIIYAEYEPGIQLEALYDPFWINGTLSTTLIENDMATAAYSIDVSAIEPYSEPEWVDSDLSEPELPEPEPEMPET